MSRHKNKRGGRDEDWIESGNGSDYGGGNQPRETNGAGNGSVGENSGGRNNLLLSAVTSQDRSSFNLQPYTETVWETTQAIAAAQRTMQKLNDMYVKHMDAIDSVPSVYQELSKLKKECMYKNEKIKRQKHMIIELQTDSEEQEAELAKRRANLEKDEGEIEKLKQEQLKKAAKAEKSVEIQKLEIKHQLEEEFSNRKNVQERQHTARMKQLEEQTSTLKTEWESKMKKLEAVNKKLSNDLGEKEERIRELADRLKTAKDDLDDTKTAKTAYKRDKEILEVKLRAVENEFDLNTQTTDFYKEKFAEISGAIEEMSSQFFKDLPSDDFEKIQKDLIAIDQCFNSIPITDSDTSQDLRIAYAQRIISSALCTNIWQPFSSEKALSNPNSASLLDNIYKDLADSTGNNGRAASVWKVLTMRSLQSSCAELPLSQTSRSQGGGSQFPQRARQAVSEMLKKLSPLIDPKKAQLEESLLHIAKSAVDVWELAQTDVLMLTTCVDLNPSERNTWRSVRFDPVPDDEAGEMDIKSSTRPRVFTLFPRVVAQDWSPVAEPSLQMPGTFSMPQQKIVLTEISIHQGIGLAECSALVVRGKDEEEERKEYLQEVMRDARKLIAQGGRTRVNGRTASISGSVTGSMS